MTRIKILLALVAAFIVFAEMPARGAEAATPDDTAKFLAGLPVSADSPLAPLTESAGWKAHASQLNKLFASFEERQSSKIRDWSGANLPSPKPTLFYMFSGPDFLYADAFFAGATNYVLSGLEPVGEIPDVTKVRPSAVPEELARLRTSMSSLLSISFFITHIMRSELRSGHFLGTLPVIYVFLARTGHTIHDVSLVYVDPTGELKTDDAERRTSLAQGVKITFNDKDNREQTLYYFSTNLADDGVKKSGFLLFCTNLGEGAAFVKSASYLLHGGSFGTVRSFLLDHASMVVQDDSGIPLKFFDASKWELEPFGNYVPPISIFSRNYQPKMAQLFVREKAPKINFGIGYRHSPGQSSILVAIRKGITAERAGFPVISAGP
jgi:hypothetical protein